jgi:hypothetical protein
MARSTQGMPCFRIYCRCCCFVPVRRQAGIGRSIVERRDIRPNSPTGPHGLALAWGVEAGVRTTRSRLSRVVPCPRRISCAGLPKWRMTRFDLRPKRCLSTFCTTPTAP